jgi:hypothetical protein
LLLGPAAFAAEQPPTRPVPRMVAEPGAARVPAARVIRAVDRSPAPERIGERQIDRGSERLIDRGGERQQRHADRNAPERRTAERPATDRPRAERTSRPDAKPDRTPGQRHAARPAAEAPDRHGLRAAPRAIRPARAGHPSAHGRKPRLPRAPGSLPVLRDAPQELLPAPESLDLARATLPTTPRAACLAAARRAEQVHELPPGLLVAVAMSESSLNALAIKVGSHSYHPRDIEAARDILAHAPRRSSPMVGCVQVNARVHAKGSDWPLDPLRATDWAGGMLRRWHQETGDWVEALRRWHGGSARTEHAVLCRVRAKLEVANPENAMLRDYACAESEVAKVRRQGRGILEVAEYPEPTEATAPTRLPALVQPAEATASLR